jgi:ribonucleoside-diphosphate reductase alpha chain
VEVEKWLNGNQFSLNIWKNKYQFNNEETLEEWFDRVSGGDPDIRRLIVEKKFLFAGRVLANRGIQKYGKKIVYNNCFVLPSPEDNLESIFDTAKHMARIYSTGGGVGIDISSLCPNGSKVNNAAEFSSGPISFANLYNLTTDIISQSGRR